MVVRGNNKTLKPEYDCLMRVKDLFAKNKNVRSAEWNAVEIEVLNNHLFITAKPVIYLVNLTEKDFLRKKNKWLVKIKEWVDTTDNGAAILPLSVDFEARWVDLSGEEQEAFSKENAGACSSLGKIIQLGYKTLQLHYFFTTGKDEVKAWTIQRGTKAPQAAGKIHSDMEKGFIMAEVMSYEDFHSEGSEVAVKAAGKYKQKGREYIVEDGDIIFFKFNAGAGLNPKKK